MNREFSDCSNSEKQHIMNVREYSRNVPSQPLQQYFDARPVSTKYSLMPIVDPRKPISVPVTQVATFNTRQMFNPGNDFGPWSGYAANVNKESVLRNQIFALQKCPQAVYVPSSKSDLYQHTFSERAIEQPHSYLFEQPRFDHFDPNPNKLSRSLFNNATRVELRDISNVRRGTDEFVK